MRPTDYMMFSRIRSGAILAIAMSCCAVSVSLAQPTYSVIDLGAFSAAGTSAATDLNDAGQIVGNSMQRPFLWENGTMTELPGLDEFASASSVAGINNLGEAAGRSTDFFGTEKAVLWKNDTVTDLGDFAGFISQGLSARAINDSTRIIGDATVNGGGRLFSWSAGTMNEVTADAVGAAINNQNQIVGWDSNTSRAMLIDPGSGQVDLGTLPGDTFSLASDINENGQIVGWSSGSSLRHPTLFTPNTSMDLGDLPGGNDSWGFASGINDAGVIVGTSDVANGNHAFIWDDVVGMRDLNNLVDASGLGWTLTSARSINASGQIVGTGINPSGLTRGFLLTASQSADGDFDDNGEYECADIDLLILEIAAGTNGLGFDLTGDSVVTLADRDAWLVEGGAAELPSQNAFLLGDVDLDGTVNSTDLGQLLNNFDAVSGVAYCGGDLNADSNVDSTDLGLLLNNFDQTAASAIAVPEPESVTWMLFFLAGILAAVRRPGGSKSPKVKDDTVLPRFSRHTV